MSITPQVYAKARAEIVAVFGWNADSLSPDQTLRIDVAVALRLAVDDLQGRVVRGETIDVTRMLTASEALSRLLPPAVLANAPEQRDDHEAHEAAIAPLRKLFRYLHGRVAELEDENAQLRAALGGAPALPVHAPNLGHDPINPPTSAIVPSSEQGETYAGKRLTPDDMKAMRPKPVIDARPQNWDDTPGGKAWNEWRAAGGYAGDPWANNNRG